MSTDQPTQTLLFLAYQRSARELERAILHGDGHGALRPKYGAVLGQLDEHGTRATALARGAGMTKAAMGQLIDELEQLGYVERSVDPSDRRAKLVLPKAPALDVLAILADFNDRWETRHRLLLGEEAYESLRSSLHTIASAPDDEQVDRQT